MLVCTPLELEHNLFKTQIVEMKQTPQKANVPTISKR